MKVTIEQLQRTSFTEDARLFVKAEVKEELPGKTISLGKLLSWAYRQGFAVYMCRNAAKPSLLIGELIPEESLTDGWWIITDHYLGQYDEQVRYLCGELFTPERWR